MESSHLPKESILPNMCMESLPLAISITAVWLECSCILLDTHTLILLTLSIVLQDICFVHEHTLKSIGCYLKATFDEGLIMKPSEKLLKIDSFSDPLLLLECMDTNQWMILSE